MNWLLFTVAILATFRLAILVSLDDGPANAIKKVREAVPKWSSVWKGIRCFRCTSLWMGSVVTTWLWWIGEVPTWITVFYSAALSGAAIALNRFTE